MKRSVALLAATCFALGAIGTTSVAADEVTPSTNETNLANGWAHFVADADPGATTVTFVQPRGFVACFEVRVDGEEPQSETNYNPAVTDGLWDFTCVNNESATQTFSAEESLEIRMVFGAESDERFDWTEVEVLPAPSKRDCKKGGWRDMGHRNQGQCVASFQASSKAGR